MFERLPVRPMVKREKFSCRITVDGTCSFIRALSIRSWIAKAEL